MKAKQWAVGTWGAAVLILSVVLGVRLAVPSESEAIGEDELAGPPAPEVTAEETDGRDGMSEGIEVHGHWTIAVRDPDGTLVDTREFENDLLNTGRILLNNLFRRTNTVGMWEIQLSDQLAGPGNPCFDLAGSPHGCVVTEAGHGSGQPYLFRSLTISGSDQVTLEGNLTAQRDGVVNHVSTGNHFCDSDVTPAECNSSVIAAALRTFTATSLATPVPVLAGQSILVRVVLSFS